MSDVEFYEFRRGTVAWRYTSRRKPLVYQGQTYASASIKRGEIAQTQDLSRNVLDLTVPLDLPVLQQFQPAAPLAKISVLLRVLPANETVARGIWGGKLASVEDNTHRAIIHCLPPSAGASTAGLSECWQKPCRHVLYGPGCKASREAVRVDATLTSVGATTVQGAAFAAKPDGWFAGGYITWTTSTGLVELRWVITHVGDMLTLLTPSLVAVGTTVAAYPGCNHTASDCDTKHHNILNYGGQLYIPEKGAQNNNPGF
mgnify:CR=1 FL=1